VQEFLSGAEPDEATQCQTGRTLIGATLKKHPFCTSVDHRNLVHEVRQYVATSITKHRFIARDQCSLELTLKIIDSRKSGKSMLLQFYSDQVSLELPIAGDQKHIFLFIRDAKDFVPFMLYFRRFRRPFTETLCLQISIQPCAVAKWIPDICSDLETLITSVITLLFSKCCFITPDQSKIVEFGQQIRDPRPLGRRDTRLVVYVHAFAPDGSSSGPGFPEDALRR
jgi:hypothetical protein